MCRFIWTRKCRSNVQFPFLRSSYNKILVPDATHLGMWYATRAIISKTRRNSLRGLAIMEAMCLGR